MARGTQTETPAVDTAGEVDIPAATVDDGTEAVDATGAAEGTSTPAKAAKEPARGDLPEGYVTPVGFAKELSKPKDGNAENTADDNFRHTDKNGSHEVKPQMVYSYMRNASKENPFPIETVKDSLNHDRQALKLEAGLAWWDAKNARVAERKANAAAKEQKKAEKASQAGATNEDGSQVVGDTTAPSEVVEAE
jgi:hypothetical protein